MRPRVEPAVLSFLGVVALIGLGCWWTTRAMPDGGDRVLAFVGMLALAAVAFQFGVQSRHR